MLQWDKMLTFPIPFVCSRTMNGPEVVPIPYGPWIVFPNDAICVVSPMVARTMDEQIVYWWMLTRNLTWKNTWKNCSNVVSERQSFVDHSSDGKKMRIFGGESSFWVWLSDYVSKLSQPGCKGCRDTCRQGRHDGVRIVTNFCHEMISVLSVEFGEW